MWVELLLWGDYMPFWSFVQSRKFLLDHITEDRSGAKTSVNYAVSSAYVRLQRRKPEENRYMNTKLMTMMMACVALAFAACGGDTNTNVRNANSNMNTNVNRAPSPTPTPVCKNANMTREEYEKNKGACENEKGSSTIGQGIDDSWIWFKTRAALLTTSDLRESTINVDVVNAMITL